MINLIRDKTVITVVGLLLLGVILGKLHDGAVKHTGGFAVQNLIQTLTMPLQKASTVIVMLGDQSVRAMRPRSAILRENSDLRKRVRQLTMENERLRTAAEENLQLKLELGFKQTVGTRMIAARVISRSQSNWFDTAVLDRGHSSGVAVGSAVMNHLGMIGQVVEVGPYTCQVVALTDPSSSVGAMVDRSRAAGIIQGQGSDELTLAYLSKDADIGKRDLVVTSGMGKVVPKGFVVGRVRKVVRDRVAGTATAAVKPSVKFDELEYVFIVQPGSGDR
jgi:rod shape-determining protein MreC